MTYVVEYKIPFFGWDHEECYDLEEVKEVMKNLKSDYGEDLGFRVWKVTKKRISLESLNE